VERAHSRDRCPFQVLFPLAGEEARRELTKEGCSVEYLAEVVVVEAFLLRLCLKVQKEQGYLVLSCTRSSRCGQSAPSRSPEAP
jgi:hypothetical protein